MPKLKKFKPPEQEAREAELRKLYGGMMDISNVCVELGHVDRRTASKWVSGVPAVRVNKQLRFRVADIAALEYDCREVAP